MSTFIRVYLDDIRTPPEGWTLVKTYEECVEALLTGEVEHLSLDHDLADEHYALLLPDEEFDYSEFKERTGYDVCKWMVENNVWPKTSITLHSANPPGRENMRVLINANKPEGLLVFG